MIHFALHNIYIYIQIVSQEDHNSETSIHCLIICLLTGFAARAFSSIDVENAHCIINHLLRTGAQTCTVEEMARLMSHLQRMQILSKKKVGRFVNFICWDKLSLYTWSKMYIFYLCTAYYKTKFPFCKIGLLNFKIIMNCNIFFFPHRTVLKPSSSIYPTPRTGAGLSDVLTSCAFDKTRSNKDHEARPYSRNMAPKNQTGVRTYGHKSGEASFYSWNYFTLIFLSFWCYTDTDVLNVFFQGFKNKLKTLGARYLLVVSLFTIY